MTLSHSFSSQIKDFNFLPLIKKEQNGRMRTRLLALQNLKEGQKITEICSNLKIARERVYVWAKRFIESGIEGLRDLPGRGRKPWITDEQKAEVAKFIDDKAKSNNGGRVFGEDIVRFVFESFNIKYSLSSAYELIHELGFSWITSRSIHPKADLPSQEMFKKNLAKCRICNTKKHYTYRRGHLV
jgi:transposase